MFSKLSVWHKLLILVLIPLSFEGVFVISLAALLRYTQQQTENYERSRNVLQRVHEADSELVTLLYDMTVSIGDNIDQLIVNCDTAKAGFFESQKKLMAATSSDPQLKEATHQISNLVAQATNKVDETKKRALAVGPSAYEQGRFRHSVRQEWVVFGSELNDVETTILNMENRLQGTPEQLRLLRVAITLLLGLAILVSVALSAAAALLFARNIVDRLHLIAEDAQAIAMGAELAVPGGDGDEITKLSNAVRTASQVLAETRRKELAVLDVATDVMCSLDKRLRFTAIGPAVVKAWGFEADDLMGESIAKLMSEASAGVFRNFVSTLPLSGANREIETVIFCKDKSNKDILWKVNWSADHEYYFCVAHDITARREADRMKQRFLSIASHDLRTPLSSISAKLSLLLQGARGPLPDELRNVLKRAETNLARLTELINDLLDIEKLEAGKVIMKLGPVGALALCQEACDSLESLATNMKVSIKRPNNDATILGDERQLLRVVINLLSNAIKFSPLQSTVTVSINTDDQQFVKISVSDQGPGVPPEDRELVFEKFKQSKAAQSAIKGTGLGLAISKLVVDAHHGKIGIASNLPCGSIFSIELPVYEDPPS